jgi:uncharacterized protein
MIIGLGGIFAAIALVIWLTHRRVKLGWAMLAGSLGVAVCSGLAPIRILEVFWGGVSSPTTVNLVLIIGAITVLGHMLRETGSLQDIIESLNRLVRDIRLLMALIPALVALFMVPGGAVFSIPMLGPLGEKLNMKAETTAAVNIIYRHLSYLVFPFYTSLLLMSQLTGVNVYFFIRFNFPVLLLALVFSFFYFFRGIPQSLTKNDEARVSLKNLATFFSSSLAFIIVLVLGVGFHLYFPLALLAGIFYVILVGNPNSPDPKTLKERAALVLPGVDWSMILAIVGIMVFKDFVAASGALGHLSDVLLARGIPLLFLALLFPLLTGLITGNNAAALGISVPLFLPLVPPGARGEAYLAVMFVSGLMGYLASPFHLCLVLSTQYLGASLPRVIQRVMLASVIIIAVSLLPLFLLY